MDEQPQSNTTGQEDLPPSLERALNMPDDYAVRLRTGEVVRFTRAERHGAFVTLFETEAAQFPNGLEVRITEIAWCARGPGQLVTESPMPQLADAAQSTPGVRVPLRIHHPET